MAQVTKIRFSDDEMDLLSRSDFFLLKHSAMEKVMQLFAELQEELKAVAVPHLDVHPLTEAAKIFRGDNYRKLPYVVLDYPKHFTADSIFAFRTMLWWGNEFSFTMHLYGHSLDHFRKNIVKNVGQLSQKQFFFCVNSKQWEYHFEDNNYIPLDKFLGDRKTEITEKNFIKLSRRLPVDQYENVVEYGKETFELLMNLLR